MGYHCGHMGLSPEEQVAGQSSPNSHSSMAEDSSKGHSFFLFKRESFLFLIMCMLAGEVALGDQKRASDPPGAGVKGRCKHPAWVLGAPSLHPQDIHLGTHCSLLHSSGVCFCVQASCKPRNPAARASAML